MNATTSTPDYAPAAISDREYPVTAARVYGHELVVGGDNGWGRTVTAIRFYTGFAGCPARYYVTSERATPTSTGSLTQTVVLNATGLYPDPASDARRARHTLETHERDMPDCADPDCEFHHPDATATPTHRGATTMTTDREADRRHDFETEGRQDQRTVTPCAVCGLARSAAVHR